MSVCGIVDLRVVEGKEPTVPPGWQRIPVDLNKGAHGAYLWLCFREARLPASDPQFVRGVRLSFEREYEVPAGWTAISTDLNKEAHGLWIHLLFTRAPVAEPVTEIRVFSAADAKDIVMPSGYERVTGEGGLWDLNAKTRVRGDYIAVGVRRGGESQEEISADQKNALLQQYAPLIHLARDEVYNPTAAEYLFDHVERKPRASEDNTYCLQTREIEREQLRRDPSLVFDWFKPPFANPPLYAFWVTKHYGYDLVYFLYCPYNRGKEVMGTIWGNHVSDWEHLTVRLDKHTLQPTEVHYAAHDSGRTLPWAEAPKAAGGTRPLAFAAWGSHGLYPDVGRHVYQRIDVPALRIAVWAVGLALPIELADECSEGRAWETWRDLRTFDVDTRHALDGTPWPSWLETSYHDAGTAPPTDPTAGAVYRWGDAAADGEGAGGDILGQLADWVGEHRLNPGPTGPLTKQAITDPWSLA